MLLQKRYLKTVHVLTTKIRHGRFWELRFLFVRRRRGLL